MVYVWHKPHDLNCSICEKKPQLKAQKGCTGESQLLHVYPPSDVDYPGNRIAIRTCPVNMLEPDVVGLCRSFFLANKRVSLSEQSDIPPPYLEALEMVASEMALLDAHRAAKHGS